MRILHPTLRIWLWNALVLALLHQAGCNSQPTQPAPPPTVKRIAVLQLGTHDVIGSVVNGLRERTAELYGDQVTVTVFNPNFDMSALGIVSKQVAASDADVLVSVTTPASGPLVSANQGIKPLIFTFVSDPAAIGYVRTGSLKNTAGLSDQVDYDKVLDLIHSFVPSAKKVGYLLTRSESNAVTIHKGFTTAAPAKGFEIQTAVIGTSSDIRLAAETLAPTVDVFLFGGDNTVMTGIDALITAAHSRNKPVFACDELSVSRGALAALSVDYRQMGKNTANLCAAVFGGADPNHIPVEIHIGSRLIINRKTADSLGIEIPLLARAVAARIIE